MSAAELVCRQFLYGAKFAPIRYEGSRGGEEGGGLSLRFQVVPHLMRVHCAQYIWHETYNKEIKFKILYTMYKYIGLLPHLVYRALVQSIIHAQCIELRDSDTRFST